LRYVQRPGSSVREIWEVERVDDDDEASPYIKDLVSFAAFQKSATTGQWRHRRDDHWREVKARVLTHIQSEAVKSEIVEIEQLEALKQVTLQHIVGDATAGIAAATPKSLEGAVGAFVSLDKRVSQKREVVAAETAAAATTVSLTAGESGEASTLALKPGLQLSSDKELSEDEIVALAKALAAARAGITVDDNSDVTIPEVGLDKTQ
jgi:hypothetical protein